MINIAKGPGGSRPPTKCSAPRCTLQRLLTYNAHFFVSKIPREHAPYLSLQTHSFFHNCCFEYFQTIFRLKCYHFKMHQIDDFFFRGACLCISLKDSRLPTLNAHYQRSFFISKLPGEHVPISPMINSQFFSYFCYKH